ncbi:MAG TPA: helix-turn-helix domain-containing protein [Bryobacteraceae bacterium]|nr:helix-turn-helix domain-containing protein [Bryobacteraceae bacterium]
MASPADRARAQTLLEEFTDAVWHASALGRKTLIEVVSRFFEEQAVMRSQAAVAKVQTPEFQGSLDDEVRNLRRRRIEQALEDSEGNASAAAEMLGMNRSSFVSELRRHGLRSNGRSARRKAKGMAAGAAA